MNSVACEECAAESWVVSDMDLEFAMNGDNRNVPNLNVNDGERNLDNNWYDNERNADNRFLLVRK